MPERIRSGWWGVFARHPVITAIFAVCIALGAVLGFALLGDEWSAARRIAAGAVSGAGAALLVTATKWFE
jgi:hypothetical protein